MEYGNSAAASGPSAIVLIIYLALIVLIIASLWKLFSKADEPGWAAIVPIYSGIVFLRIAGKPWWWIFLLMIPLVGLIFAIIATIDFAKAYNKGTGFALGLIFLGFIFYPIMAFGSATYNPMAVPKPQ